MHFRVGGGISWKEQADVILASLSVGVLLCKCNIVLVASHICNIAAHHRCEFLVVMFYKVEIR